MKRKIVVAVTGTSGALYASVLFQKLREIKNQIDEVAVVFSSNYCLLSIEFTKG